MTFDPLEMLIYSKWRQKMHIFLFLPKWGWDKSYKVIICSFLGSQKTKNNIVKWLNSPLVGILTPKSVNLFKMAAKILIFYGFPQQRSVMQHTK